MTNETKKEAPEKGRTASGRSAPRQAGEKKGTRGGYRGPKKAAAERQPAESARTGKEKEKKAAAPAPSAAEAASAQALWDGPGSGRPAEESGAGDAGASDYAGGAQRNRQKHHHV